MNDHLSIDLQEVSQKLANENMTLATLREINRQLDMQYYFAGRAIHSDNIYFGADE